MSVIDEGPKEKPFFQYLVIDFFKDKHDETQGSVLKRGLEKCIRRVRERWFDRR